MRFALVLAALIALVSRPGSAAQHAVTVQPSGAAVPVSDGLFGVNYVWHLMPQDVFAAADATLRSIGATIVRYPGGRVAERFDWRGNKSASEFGPGVDPDKFSGQHRTGQGEFRDA